VALGEENLAGLPPALSRSLVFRTRRAGVCDSRAARRPAGTGEAEFIRPLFFFRLRPQNTRIPEEKAHPAIARPAFSSNL
jgi:hypothetical protein